jgi:hypothetical protein
LPGKNEKHTLVASLGLEQAQLGGADILGQHDVCAHAWNDQIALGLIIQLQDSIYHNNRATREYHIANSGNEVDSQKA